MSAPAAPRRRRLRIAGWVALGLVVLIGLFAALNRDRIARLHAATTLFEQERIVANFSAMPSIFNAVEIATTGEPRPLSRAERPLPEAVEVAGERVAVEDWLDESATTSFLVLRNGAVEHESYHLGTGPDDLRISWSVAKSFVSAHLGQLVGDGRVDLERSVDSYVPALADSAYEGARVIDVLRMASGVAFDEDYLDFWSDINRMGRLLAIGGSMDEFAARVDERAGPAGQTRRYTSIDTHVLALVIRSVTGGRLADTLGEGVLGPLGLEGRAVYVTDSEGTAFALGGLNLTTRDYAKFGQMYLDGGRVGDAQVVPADWVAASSEPSPLPGANAGPSGRFDYGYHWWIPPHAARHGGDYTARGIYGQYIYVNPSHEVVIVKTSADRRFREPWRNGLSRAELDIEMMRGIARAGAASTVSARTDE